MKRIKSKTNRIFIKGIKLNKFKAFNKQAEIKLSPMVNLIFGRNSSGKSSILQALRLIRQSYERDQLTPFNLESPEKYKDNGGIDIDIKYRGIISDNNEQDNLSLGVKTGILSNDNKTILDLDKEISPGLKEIRNWFLSRIIENSGENKLYSINKQQAFDFVKLYNIDTKNSLHCSDYERLYDCNLIE